MVRCACRAPFLLLVVRTHLPMRGGAFLPLLCSPSQAFAGHWYPAHARAHLPGDSLRLAPVGEQPLQLVVRCDSAAALSYLNCHAERSESSRAPLERDLSLRSG